MNVIMVMAGKGVAPCHISGLVGADKPICGLRVARSWVVQRGSLVWQELTLETPIDAYRLCIDCMAVLSAVTRRIAAP